MQAAVRSSHVVPDASSKSVRHPSGWTVLAKTFARSTLGVPHYLFYDNGNDDMEALTQRLRVDRVICWSDRS